MATYNWIGGSGAFTTTASWSPTPPYPGYPGEGDSAIFDGTNQYTVTYDDDYVFIASFAGLTISDPNATFLFTDATGGPGLEASTFMMSAGTLDIESTWSGGSGIDILGGGTLTGGVINISGLNTGLEFQGYTDTITFGPALTINGYSGTPWLGVYYSLNNQGKINCTGTNGTVFSIGGGLMTNSGAITAVGNSMLKINCENLLNNGIISATQKSTIQIVNNLQRLVSEPLINNGNITADGGYVDLTAGNFNIVNDASISGSGAIDIMNGGTVRSYGGTNLNQNIHFQGAGKLIVYDSFLQDIFGFSTGDGLDFADQSYSASDHIIWQSTVNGVQAFAIEDSDNTVLTTVNFAGHYSASSFQVADDGTGHLQISYASTAPPSPALDDFNGDGKSDILWYDSGAVGLWDSTTSDGYVWDGLGPAGSGWQIAGVGDFNGDGKADVLWYNTNGAVGVWSSNGSGSYSWVGLGAAGSGWTVAGVGDFNGDGLADVLWTNSNGAVGLWDSSASGGYSWVGLGAAGSGWTVAGVGDFTGDGLADVLWYNPNGAVGLWETSASGGSSWVSLGTAGAGWQVAGVGDFTGDGLADILWYNSNGGVGLWETGASGGYSWVGIGTAGSGWTVAGVGDFNGDGLADVLWRNSSGAVGAWESNGSGGYAWTIIGAASTAWQIKAA